MANAGPDLIPLHHKRINVGQESLGGPAIMSTAYSSHQLNINGRKNRYSLSHLCYCNSSIHSHVDNQGISPDITFRQHSNGFRIIENRGVTHATITAYCSTNDNSRSTHSQAGTAFPTQISRTNQLNLGGPSTNQNSNGKNECNHEAMILQAQNCHIQSGSNENYTDGVQAEGSKNQIHLGRESQKSDSEITRDIVLALRRVGDSLDSRLRNENKKSLLAMMGVTKISGDWLVFTVLGQRSLIAAMVGLSLELARQFNSL